jgi:hypothetical protein
LWPRVSDRPMPYLCVFVGEGIGRLVATRERPQRRESKLCPQREAINLPTFCRHLISQSLTDCRQNISVGRLNLWTETGDFLFSFHTQCGLPAINALLANHFLAATLCEQRKVGSNRQFTFFERCPPKGDRMSGPKDLSSKLTFRDTSYNL